MWTDVSVFVNNILQVNNSIFVNTVDIPESDLMATNGAIHVVKNILYPGGESRHIQLLINNLYVPTDLPGSSKC